MSPSSTLNGEQLLWIDVSHERDVTLAAAALELTAETLGMIRRSSDEPALFMHDGYAHIVVIAPGRDRQQHEPHVLHCVVGPNWVLTVHRQPIEFLDHFDE